MTDCRCDLRRRASHDLHGPARVWLIAALLACALILVPFAGSAQDMPQGGAARGMQRDAPRVQAFEQKLRAQYPQTRIDEIRPTETPGLYEVVMGPNIAYIDASGRYWYFGHRYDMVERKDLTAPRLAELGRLDPASLPVESALKAVKGNGKRALYVFADPNCGYCKQLERTLSQLTDVTVYTFMLPILSQDSTDKVNAIWCAGDRMAAWKAWMLDNQAPANVAGCATPTEQVAQLARKYRIDATPTLIAGDGRKAPGAMPAAELTAWLDATAPARTATVKSHVSTP